MPASRTNENQQPHRHGRGPFRDGNTWKTGNGIESNERDVKPDIAQPTQDQTETLGRRPINTTSAVARPITDLPKTDPPHPPTPTHVANWLFQQDAAPSPSLGTGLPGLPINTQINPNTLPQQPVTFTPIGQTPGMTRPRPQNRNVQGIPFALPGSQLRQPPQSASTMIVNPVQQVNNDTPTTEYGEDSGMEDQLDSPTYPTNDSPTAAMTTQPAIPLIGAGPPPAIPAVQTGRNMNPPPNSHHPTQRRATMNGRGSRIQPYPSITPTHPDRHERAVATMQNPQTQGSRVPIDGTGRVLEYAHNGNRGQLGIGHRPGNGNNGRTRAVSTTPAQIAQEFADRGQIVPSVLLPAPPVAHSFTNYRIVSDPSNFSTGQPTPTHHVLSTPRSTFPGESFTPQVTVPGNSHAQTPSAQPAGTHAIDANGHEWSGVSLPLFAAPQVGVHATPGGDVTRMLQQTAIATPSLVPRPPRVAVPTPGDFGNNIRGPALAALDYMDANDNVANFADPAHVRAVTIVQR
jgi:hypothetical protein